MQEHTMTIADIEENPILSGVELLCDSKINYEQIKSYINCNNLLDVENKDDSQKRDRKAILVSISNNDKDVCLSHVKGSLHAEACFINNSSKKPGKDVYSSGKIFIELKPKESKTVSLGKFYAPSRTGGFTFNIIFDGYTYVNDQNNKKSTKTDTPVYATRLIQTYLMTGKKNFKMKNHFEVFSHRKIITNIHCPLLSQQSIQKLMKKTGQSYEEDMHDNNEDKHSSSEDDNHSDKENDNNPLYEKNKHVVESNSVEKKNGNVAYTRHVIKIKQPQTIKSSLINKDLSRRVAILEKEYKEELETRKKLQYKLLKLEKIYETEMKKDNDKKQEDEDDDIDNNEKPIVQPSKKIKKN